MGLKSILLIAIFLISIVCLVRYLESRSLYFPTKDIEMTPRIASLDYEDVSFKSSDGLRITGWFIPNEKTENVFLFCHGNGGNISHRIEKLKLLHELGLSVLVFDYRGYGSSEGKPSEAGIYRDTQAAYEFLLKEKNFKPQSIVIYGESLGGAAAVELASRQPVKGLVVESSFTSVRDMAKQIYPLIPTALVRDRFSSKKRIGRVSYPVMVMHSVSDEIVPFSLGEHLFELANEPKYFVKLRGGHNSTFLESGTDWQDGLRNFVESLGAVAK